MIPKNISSNKKKNLMEKGCNIVSPHLHSVKRILIAADQV